MQDSSSRKEFLTRDLCAKRLLGLVLGSTLNQGRAGCYEDAAWDGVITARLKPIPVVRVGQRVSFSSECELSKERGPKQESRGLLS